jgi:hypothetical protein
MSEKGVTFALYNINWLVFVTEMKSVYCTVRNDSLDKTVYASSLNGYSVLRTPRPLFGLCVSSVIPSECQNIILKETTADFSSVFEVNLT